MSSGSLPRGEANKQIADRLSISEETVKSRVKNILSSSVLMIEPMPPRLVSNAASLNSRMEFVHSNE
jgi:FixJ family two-component response regulator